MSLLFRNARAGIGGPLTAFAISAGRVVAPGDTTPDEIVDLQGATVLPGLVDAHVHSVQWAQNRRRTDLSAATSAAHAVSLILPAVRPGEPTMGFGFRDAFWADEMHKDLLPGEHPFVLVSNDLHTAWFNQAALSLIGRGDHPTGVLLEGDCFRGLAALPPPPAEQVDAWVTEATTAAAARGVTGVIDFEYADNVTDWQRRRTDVRVACSIPRDRLAAAIADGLRTGMEIGDLLRVGPVKMFVDGSLNTRTAYCADPYPGTTSRGLLELPPDELLGTMRLAGENGIHPAVHAIGDDAVTIALDAFHALGCPGRIEHAQLVSREDFPRFALDGLVAGVQPAHQPDDREVADVQWPGRTDRAYAFADLLAAGATIEIGSDAPVSPLDPWDGIASAVTRTDDDRPAWHPEQAISLETALAAAAGGRTGVQVGSPADLVIVGDMSDLRNPEILGTMLAGRWTYKNGV
ncbi:amidohydrolase [Herbidospora galbida]|uniref:Amidohydrolase n=1 Tax=Herbidospora galbida TaxID=2575442 RepID=A0A4U3M1M1_9ACTN|nr:amidohydrolase family protein [Herbidospora galbida]TKK81146.1 amidohydrolase [Herbidospora galbida]